MKKKYDTALAPMDMLFFFLISIIITTIFFTGVF